MIQVVSNLVKYFCILFYVIKYNDFIIRHIISLLRNGHKIGLGSQE